MSKSAKGHWGSAQSPFIPRKQTSVYGAGFGRGRRAEEGLGVRGLLNHQTIGPKVTSEVTGDRADRDAGESDHTIKPSEQRRRSYRGMAQGMALATDAKPSDRKLPPEVTAFYGVMAL